MLQIEIHHRALSASTPETTWPEVKLHLLNEKLTVAELIQRTVEEQTRIIRAKQVLEAEETYRISAREYLTTEEIQTQVTSEVVRLPAKRKKATIPALVKPATAVQNALQAFVQRKYLLLIDGKIAQSLEEEITFKPGCNVTFIRLTPLVGG